MLVAPIHDSVFASRRKVVMKGVSVHFQFGLPPLLTTKDRNREGKGNSGAIFCCVFSQETDATKDPQRF